MIKPILIFSFITKRQTYIADIIFLVYNTWNVEQINVKISGLAQRDVSLILKNKILAFVYFYFQDEVSIYIVLEITNYRNQVLQKIIEISY